MSDAPVYKAGATLGMTHYFYLTREESWAHMMDYGTRPKADPQEIPVG